MKAGLLGAFAILFLNAVWAVAQTPAPSGVVMPSTVGMQPSSVGAPLIGGVGADGGGPIWYGSADYLLWKVKDGRLPSTATATPFGVIPVTVQNTQIPLGGGAATPFGGPTTQFVLASVRSQAAFGNGGQSNTGYVNGGRFSTGFWIDPEMSYGLEVGLLFLESASDNFSVNTSPTGGAFVAPTGVTQTLFSNIFLPGGGVTVMPQSVLNVALAGNVSGRVSGTSTNSLYGGEVNARGVFVRIGGTDIGGLAGFRYLRFKDELNITSTNSLSGLMLSTPPPVNLGSMTFSSFDNTRVVNNFYGGQAGVDVDSKFGSFFVYARGKLALGNNHQVADVNSNGVTTMNGVTTSTGSGLLATSADNGRHTRDQLAFIPEVDVKVGYQFTDWLRGYVGYGGIFLGSVGRASDSTSLNTFNASANINNNITPISVAQPNFRFRNQDVTIQGVTFGFEAKY